MKEKTYSNIEYLVVAAELIVESDAAKGADVNRAHVEEMKALIKSELPEGMPPEYAGAIGIFEFISDFQDELALLDAGPFHKA